MYPKYFSELIEALRLLPGVGQRTAERYAFCILESSEDERLNLAKHIEQLTEQVNVCPECGNLSDGGLCHICSDENRNHHMICVVNSPKDVIVLEQMEAYNGLYHILGGLIHTKKGILPQDLNIDQLLNRMTSQIEEVILALDPTIEGETTALYLEKLLEGKTKVTRLAYGIPMGSHIDYTDQLTLSKAFENRKSSHS